MPENPRKSELPEYQNLIPQHKYTPVDVFREPEGLTLAHQLLMDLFQHLGLEEDEKRQLIEKITEKVTHADSVEQLETALRSELVLAGLTERILTKGWINRAEQIFSQVSPFVSGESVLDVGAGDGKVGKAIAEKMGKKVTLVDVLDYNQTDLPLDLYDGTTLPYKDNSSDTALLLTVLHHSDEPEKVLDETIRTARRIVVIESVYTNEAERKLQTFLDWFYNRVLHEGVNCPYNFNSPEGWEAVFKEKGLNVTESIDLGRDQPTVPEHHWLYVLDKPQQ